MRFLIIIFKLQGDLRKSMYYSPLYAPHFYPAFHNIAPCFVYFPQAQTQFLQIAIPPQSALESTPKSSSVLTSHIMQLPKKSVVSLEKMQKCKMEEGRQNEKESIVEKRNIIPNNINHVLSFMQRKNKSLLLVEKIILKLQGGKQGFNAKRFYAYQTIIKGKLSIHVSKSTLQTLLEHFDPSSAIFPAQEQTFYNQVCRVAVTHYLRTIAPLVTLHSRRLVETNKADHLRTQRNLTRHIQRVLRTSQTSF